MNTTTTPPVELGLDTFGDVTVDAAGTPLSADQVIRNVVAEAVLADQVGVDNIGLGEHHRPDFAISTPETVLAAIAGQTERIRLGSAVTVLSSDDPVRVFQRFSTLDALSGGRAEVILGRGSFTESFPLFGQDLADYEILFEEKLELFARLLEEERRAGEFRDAFIDVISHELRTPITTILGLTQILTRPGRKDDPAARASILSDVRAESERLHRLVEDLLVLSRVEHGRLVVETEPIEPRRLIERIISWEAAEHPGIVISLDVEPYLPIVSGEATYVEQVVRNLLDNAAKYSPPGTPVTVSARTDPDGVAIRVIDSGPGIAEDSADRLFELFYRDPVNARLASENND